MYKMHTHMKSSVYRLVYFIIFPLREYWTGEIIPEGLNYSRMVEIAPRFSKRGAEVGVEGGGDGGLNPLLECLKSHNLFILNLCFKSIEMALCRCRHSMCYEVLYCKSVRPPLFWVLENIYHDDI